MACESQMMDSVATRDYRSGEQLGQPLECAGKRSASTSTNAMGKFQATSENRVFWPAQARKSAWRFAA
jgi:hypothetical protein